MIMYSGSNAFKSLLEKALEDHDFAEILINKPLVALSENFSGVNLDDLSPRERTLILEHACANIDDLTRHVFAGMLKGTKPVVGDN